MKHYDRPPPRLRALVACVVFGALMVSCGDDDDDDSASTAATTPATRTRRTEPTSTATAPDAESSVTESSTAPSGDICADREALRTSVDALTNLDVVAEGTNSLTAAVDDVKDDLAAMRSSAGDELRPQVEAVQDALDEWKQRSPTSTPVGPRQPSPHWRTSRGQRAPCSTHWRPACVEHRRRRRRETVCDRAANAGAVMLGP